MRGFGLAGRSVCAVVSTADLAEANNALMGVSLRPCVRLCVREYIRDIVHQGTISAS